MAMNKAKPTAPTMTPNKAPVERVVSFGGHGPRLDVNSVAEGVTTIVIVPVGGAETV